MAFYIKFFGSNENRSNLDFKVIDEVKRSECHKVAGFSKAKPPTKFKKNDTVYLAKMVKDDRINPKKDYVIFGVGLVADEFTLPRDEATVNDTLRIPFRKKWPLYIQLNQVQLLNSKMCSGIRVQEIIEQFSHGSFENSYTQHVTGSTRTIRQSFCNQPYAELREISAEWLAMRLQERFNTIGIISQEYLENFNIPENAL